MDIKTEMAVVLLFLKKNTAEIIFPLNTKNSKNSII